jgi:hypothetical protein
MEGELLGEPAGSLPTPPARIELATNRLTADRSTAELQRNTNEGVTTLLFYLELTKELILLASSSTCS